ncbi:MAG: tRNA (adenosine(37)-N6)-threonylcarbamoyltransferase complex transferase subunit TsaD [Pyramidobacter sp.]
MRPLERPFLTLGIESSCDDTSLALLEGARRVKSWNISSQISTHARFGGVVPEYASRMHLEAILPLTEDVLRAGGVTDPAAELDLIAVTRGPGLMGSLLVGVMTAKAFAQAWNVPILGVNHLEGHIYANMVDHDDLEFPFLCMVVSGGHTEIVLAKGAGDFEVLGTTQDDAAGEAFDKVAKVLGLPYPGGPVIDKLARRGDAGAFRFPDVTRTVEGLNFSFSGLKTAAMNQINSMKLKGAAVPVEDFCASFQAAVVRTLVTRLHQAVKLTGVKRVAISGGVAANSRFREAVAQCPDWKAFLPSKMFCTDNGVMVAAAGYAAWQSGRRGGIDLAPDPTLDLGEDGADA